MPLSKSILLYTVSDLRATTQIHSYHSALNHCRVHPGHTWLADHRLPMFALETEVFCVLSILSFANTKLVISRAWLNSTSSHTQVGYRSVCSQDISTGKCLQVLIFAFFVFHLRCKPYRKIYIWLGSMLIILSYWVSTYLCICTSPLCY